MWQSTVLILILQWYIVVCHLDEPSHAHLHPAQRSSASLVRYINQLNTTWTAKPSHLDQLPFSAIKRMCGAVPPHDGYTSSLSTIKTVNFRNLPKEFDARKQWPKCATISEIRNQGDCGSCWAVAAVAAMSDRICISSEGTTQVRLSALDLLSCCSYCGYGCNGGMPDRAWTYWVKSGIVTGGDYNSHCGCRPYSIPPIDDQRLSRLLSSVVPTPECVKQCDKPYNETYEHDKHYGSKAYHISTDIDDIRSEIYRNGPVVAVFMVFEDFKYYKSGVYQHKGGRQLGWHAVKLFGWGEEDGTPYWLAANSWGTLWGDKGFFKILRGSDECGIEEDITGGLPDHAPLVNK